MGGNGIRKNTEPRTGSSRLAKLLPWLLLVCLVCFVGLAALWAIEALTGLPAFSRATPTPAFPAGTEVRLVGRDGTSVTVWQMGEACQVGNAFGQVPAGSSARILAEACYSREDRTTYYRIALNMGATGWVEAADIVTAAAYTPPLPTQTQTPRPSPPATSVPPQQPTQKPTPVPLPVGSSLTAGNWGIRVDRMEVVGSLFSPSGDKVIQAQGRFAVVFLTATNWGFHTATLHASSVYIEDAEGNRYENDDLGSAYASSIECRDYALDIGPDESVCVIAAIDISEESQCYVLSMYGAEEAVLLEVP